MKLGFAPDVILRVEALIKHYPIERGAIFKRRAGSVKAVDGISFSIAKGETLGLVGESGCGKTTTGRLILRLIDPTSGRIIFKGEDITEYGSRKMRPIRRKMQVVFQDPYSSLNPRMTVGEIIEEPLRIHGVGTRAERKKATQDLLEVVGLSPSQIGRYPHEFSGGQRQRIGIARALALRPEFVVCDEPVSALDVSIRSQIINLLKDLQKEFGLTYLFISHDLSVVRHVADRIAVMYLGKIVEMAKRESLYGSPAHPYTRALLESVPIPDPSRRTSLGSAVAGEAPNSPEIASGCRFRPRCPRAIQKCSEEEPELREIDDGHFAACFLARKSPVVEQRARKA